MRFIVTDERVYIAVQHIVSLRASESGGTIVQCVAWAFHTDMKLEKVVQACKEAGLEVPD